MVALWTETSEREESICKGRGWNCILFNRGKSLEGECKNELKGQITNWEVGMIGIECNLLQFPLYFDQQVWTPLRLFFFFKGTTQKHCQYVGSTNLINKMSGLNIAFIFIGVD